MKELKYLLTVILGVISCTVYSQMGAVVAGGEGKGTGSVSFSVGQIDYISAGDTSGNVYQGLQQPIELYTIDLYEDDEVSYALPIYPNPTESIVYIDGQISNKEGLKWKLHSTEGRLLLHGNVAAEDKTLLQLESLSSGVYFLLIYENSKIEKKLKIIKK